MAKDNPLRDHRDHRFQAPRNANVRVNAPSAQALQGALLAYSYTTPSRANNLDAIMSHPPPVSLLDSDPDPPPELPEPGSIKDKIAKFSANSTKHRPNDRPGTALSHVSDISRQKTPQLVAAEIAARRSPAPSDKPTVDVQKLQSQRSNPPNRGLACPVPIRKTTPHSNHLLDAPADDNYGFRSATPTVEQKFPPLKPSTSPQPPITKLRPVPPVPRKSLPLSSELAQARDRSRLEYQERYDETTSRSLPLRSKASASTLPEEPAPALPPRRAATLATQDGREQAAVPTRTRSPVWPSGSSVASLYTQSHNPSSSSLLDSLSDAGKDAHSDAVAASSLASNRALQAKKTPPTPPPQRRRRSRSRSLLQLKRDSAPSPSPGGLRETLRTPAKSDDEDDNDHRHRRHIINKHPHKHQEGDRRRWRSEVSEKERKRYEGVWAANKGLLIPRSQIMDQKGSMQDIPSGLYPPAALDMVVNLVVRDIWTRSRLPKHVLEQIWNLVDRQNIGLLTREEFVVGMWLIDQQLRGRKLPATVPDSVWASVSSAGGIPWNGMR
ncbi:hypothetical protein BJX61DRAFT_85511 [Aspergillus egyptiacus]|nr:hypothetical protein BJX61DRAFT_85511 [Aspergillus egyptiacus]